ncbi:hypothetical protein DBR32_02030 [Taibaiella sp. KBW10]|nr:hypothetical protein DBR32_02030 [Taibaiella sp. KBW10]
MDQNHNTNKEELLDNELDIKLYKPSSSRFFFLLGFFGFFIFAWSGCYNLYQHKFVDKKDIVPVNESSLYEPKYK